MRYGRRNRAQRWVMADAVKDRIMAMMDNRIRFIAEPPDLDYGGFYDQLVPPRIQTYMAEVEKFMPGVLRTDNDTWMSWDIAFSPVTVHNVSVIPTNLYVNFGKEYYMPPINRWSRGPTEFRFKMSMLNRETQQALTEWVTRFLQVSQERSEVETKLNDLFQACSTAGQVYRVWPELLHALPEHMQVKLSAAQKRSPFPLRLYSPEGEISRLWMPEALGRYNELISAAAMLPTVAQKVWPLSVEARAV